ncbi:Concanavalin A-like lectin/glucanase subgroup [Penicillium manginii]|uniref:Concanavalin A-like lectin/glucanase subgroup n=1 Tax=Penicillium manginii TaxID=203109 RepID=UPI0025473912|nr:Concanavalin A-like lectin/glucanase subgroup [Penicillium manginii]KAJ5739997.1 Concanavalin A-like lectin/glucanase subgroup [Penicillium manginii]
MVSSSLRISAGSLFLLSLASSVTASSSYSLVENWHGDKFLDFFNFHVGEDPTNGFVNYVDQSSAESSGLVKVLDSGGVYIGVDHKKTISTSSQGRDSVRIGSKKYYDESLVIADLAHMPGSVCGSWPAFWSVGKNWPADGEIDIIEGVNLQDHNEIVMHTAGTCSITDTGMTGSVNATGCGEDLGTVGCVIEGQEGSYGTSFNKQGGGVYAMEWTDKHVKIWFFPRSKIPASITSGSPDVTQFGTPMALVQDGCDVANSFKEQSFVFDVTFCGDWAGGVYGQSGCPMSGSDSSTSCRNYVANHPAAFTETYWEINSVKIYQTGVKRIAETTTANTVATQATATHASVAQETTTKTSITDHTVTKADSAASSTSQAEAESAAVKTSSTEGTHAADSAATSEAVGIIGELSPTSTAVAATTTANAATQAVVESASNESSSKVKTTRIVTEFVTATTTLCPAAESSSIAAVPANHETAASSSVVVETPNVVKSSNSAPIAESVPTQAAEASQPTNSAGTQQANAATTHAAQSPAPTTPIGADAVSNTSAEQGSSSTQRPLPTIIPAPGVNPDSASAIANQPQTSKALIPTATDASVPSGSTFPGTPSSSGNFALFTSGADKLSTGFSVFAVALGFAMAV